jgi:hypothetical protein
LDFRIPIVFDIFPFESVRFRIFQYPASSFSFSFQTFLNSISFSYSNVEVKTILGLSRPSLTAFNPSQMLIGLVPLVVVRVVGVLSLVVVRLLDVLHLVVNTTLGEIATLSRRGATEHTFLSLVLVLLPARMGWLRPIPSPPQIGLALEHAAPSSSCEATPRSSV